MKNLPLKVGIVGGGQLSRMLALAAHSMGLEPFIVASKKTECALQVVDEDHAVMGITKPNVKKLSKEVAALAIESEFNSLEVLRAAGSKLKPTIKCLSLIQSKLQQKKTLKKARIPTQAFVEVSTRAELQKAQEIFGNNIVLKQAHMGYDGKGTFIHHSKRPFDPSKFAKQNPEFFGYGEELAQFTQEISVVVARSIKGEVKAFPVVDTFQEDGICSWTRVPSKASRTVTQKALSIAKKVITKFGGVGVFGVEMFVLKGGKVVVNELAPRVHNTGHWTMNGCSVSQFEQHWRAVLGWPLAEPQLRYPGFAMANIVGRKKKGRINLKKEPAAGSWVHWYGKTGGTFKRKLGHVNAWSTSGDKALAKAKKGREEISI